MTTPATPRRRWFSFSLRTLFVLVTVLGVFLTWLGVQLKWIQDRKEALKWLADGHGMFHEGFEDRMPIAPLSVRIFGEPAIGYILLPEENASHGPRIKLLFPEAQVEAVDILDPHATPVQF